jgi:hypothetical protein
MRYLILLLLLPAFLWGAKILSYNVYDRNDRVDVMLTFDTPYEGVLRQNRQGNTVVIKLEEAFIDAPTVKNVNSKYLEKLTIAPQGEHIEIVAQVSADVSMQASKTSDSYGLRLRFMPSAAPTSATEQPAAPVDETSLAGLPTKSNSEFEQSYYVVIVIMLIGIAILFWLKQNIAKRTATIQTEPKTPWLFNKTAAEPKSTPVTPTKGATDAGGVHIRFQKTLDPSHTVAMLDYGTMSYLVLLGNNTILLDKYQDNIPITQNDFETLLQSKHRELDGYFQLAPPQDEAFDSYKEKASGVY